MVYEPETGHARWPAALDTAPEAQREPSAEERGSGRATGARSWVATLQGRTRRGGEDGGPALPVPQGAWGSEDRRLDSPSG